MSALEHASGVIWALQTSMLLLLVTLRVRLHERRNKLILVWDFNPACSHEVSFWLHFKTTQYFISGSVYMIFHHMVFCQMTDLKSIPAMSFKHTCALHAISNKSALIHFVSSKFCSYENLMPVWNFISDKITDTKSIPFWVSFRLHSCEHK